MPDEKKPGVVAPGGRNGSNVLRPDDKTLRIAAQHLRALPLTPAERCAYAVRRGVSSRALRRELALCLRRAAK
jgi:hypothetical protein